MTRTTRTRWAGVALAAAVVLAASWVAPHEAAAGPGSTPRTVLNDVHTDSVDVRYDGSALRIGTRIGTPPYEFAEPDSVLFQLRDNDSARLSVPDLPEYAFLGAAGSPIWIAPEVQDPSLLFAGWDTEGLPTGAFAGDTVDLHLRGVTGPGEVEVFQTDAFGQPLRVFSSTDAAHTSTRLGVGQHAHANWGFTALGRYRLTFEVTATAVDGRVLSSGPVDYTWYVGGIDAADVVADPTSTALTVSTPSSAAGEPVVLTGEVDPADARGWIEFFDGQTPLGHQEVRSGTARLSTSDLGSGARSLTARFIPLHSNDHVPSVSPPVAHEVIGGPTSSSSSSSSSSSAATTTTTTTTTTSTTKPVVPPPPPATVQASGEDPTTTTTRCVPVTSTTGVVLGNGHVDYAARIVDGRFVSQVKDGTVAGKTEWRSPAQVVFHLGEAAATTVPSPAFAFLGPVSAKIWQIPQTQKPGVLWAGWNTEEIGPAQATGEVDWKLTGVDGPGTMAIYELDSFGQPKIIFDSGDGVPDRVGIRTGTHAHGNWAFSAQGAYRLTFVQSVTLASGATASDTQVVTFAIGDTDAAALLPTTTTGCGVQAAGGLGLAGTGVALLVPLLAGGGLLLSGAVVVLVLRRRREVTSSAAPDRV